MNTEIGKHIALVNILTLVLLTGGGVHESHLTLAPEGACILLVDS